MPPVTSDPVLQAMFDIAVTNIREQGCLSWMEVTATNRHLVKQCYYRHPQNPKIRCAVGHLIPDELYSPLMEDLNCIGLLGHYPDLAKHLGTGDLDISKRTELVLSLQRAHDQADNVSEFLMKACRVAKDFNLNPEKAQ